MPDLTADLVLRICSFLPPNDIACTARLLCKASAKNFSAQRHGTVRLSQPVPPHAFTARYGPRARAEPLKQLSWRKKCLLLALTAGTGVMDNVLALHSRKCWPAREVELPPALDAASAAARNGHMPVVHLFLRPGFQVPSTYGMLILGSQGPVEAVVRHCGLADVQWLLQQLDAQCRPHQRTMGLLPGLAAAAARSATPDARAKLAWLLQNDAVDRTALLKSAACAAAERDDLPFVQWALQQAGASPSSGAASHAGRCPLPVSLATPAAHGSVAVLTWMLKHWEPSTDHIMDATLAAAGAPAAGALRLLLPHALGRLRQSIADGDQEGQDGEAEFLLSCLRSAARAGGLEPMQLVWEEGAGVLPAGLVGLSEARLSNLLTSVVQSGSVQAAEWLWQQAWQQKPLPAAVGQEAVEAAVRRADLPMLSFLRDSVGADWPPAQPVSNAALSSAAVRGGDVGVLEWLHARGCPLECGPHLLAQVLQQGELSVLHWLVDKGHVRGEALQGESVIADAAFGGCAAMIEWLAARGCPMGQPGEAYMAAGRNGDLDTLDCLQRLDAPWGQRTLQQARLATRMGRMPASALSWMEQQQA